MSLQNEMSRMMHSVQKNTDGQSQFNYHFADFILLRLASLPTNIIDQPVMSDTTALIEQRLTLEAEWKMLAPNCHACIDELLRGAKMNSESISFLYCRQLEKIGNPNL